MPKRSANYILKKDKPALHAQIDTWLDRETGNIEALEPSFRNWFHDHVAQLRDMINQPTAYYWQVNSFTKHIGATVKRMQSGEIRELTSDGGFLIQR